MTHLSNVVTRKTAPTALINKGLIYWLLLFPIISCYEQPKNDVIEPSILAHYFIYYCAFCKDSRLPKPSPKPKLRISQNYPRLGASPMSNYALAAGTVRALYDDLDDSTVKKYLRGTPNIYGTNIFPNSYPGQKEHNPPDIIFIYESSLKFLEQEERPSDYIFKKDGNSDISRNIKMLFPGYSVTPIAKEALVFFGDKKNPVESLTLEEVRGIYSGRLNNWLELSGIDEPIVAYRRDIDSESERFMLKVMADHSMQPPAKERVVNFWTGYDRWHTIEYRHGRNAMGYSFRMNIKTFVPIKDKEKIKLFAIDGVTPTEENIRSGKYPLSETIIALVLRRNSLGGQGEAVLNWLVSPEGKNYIHRLGYVPL